MPVAATRGLVAIDRTKSYEAIVEQILHLVSDGTWPAGEKIPSERDLMGHLGVGRTSVREALRVLEALGVIETRQGEGSFVRAAPGPMMPEGISARLIHGSSRVIEAYDVRMLLEPKAAYWAAQRGDRVQGDELGALLQNMESMQHRIAQLAEHDRQFHLKVAEMSGNDFLCEFLRIILRALKPSWLDLLTMPQRPVEAVAEHREVYQAIRSGRPERAEAAMADHLNMGQEKTLRHYRERIARS